MLQKFLYVSFALLRFSSASPGTSHGCSSLAAQLPHLTYFPGTFQYTNQSTDIWSESCLLDPGCVFLPNTAQDIASALSIITRTNTPFSVRGGGHMPVPGAQSTDGGVFIALTNMDQKTLTKGDTILELGPGSRWGAVYDYISPFGIGVVGGRYGPVGVPGLLLGGGINYFGPRFGWAANSVVNYEVVLANSSIVDVNANSYPDLFWALKGGSSNYGIVTRFDVKTYPVTDVYGGTTTYNTPQLPQFLHAISSFIQPGGGAYDPDTTINTYIFVTPSTGVVLGTLLTFHQGNDPSPASVSNFTVIPSLTNDVSLRTSFRNFTDETFIPAFDNRSSRDLFMSTGAKASLQTVSLLNQTFIEAINNTPALENIEGYSLNLAIQPITTDWLAAARAAGGDAIDLDPADGTFVAVLIVSNWLNASDDELVNQWSTDTIAAFDKATKAAGIYYPFIYLNDAAKGQTPFPFYGKGKSLPKMKAIAKKYDPSGVFQLLDAGGFKLGI